MSIKKIMLPVKSDLPMKRQEYDPFSLLRYEMETLFDSFMRSFDLEPFESRLAFNPKVDITESDKEIRVSAELPGMDEKNIDISLGKDSLTIKGEKKQEQEEKGKDYYRMERSYGSFSRVIPLPEEIDSAKVDAHFRKGVLTVVLPKTVKAVESKKKIEIKGE